MSFSEVDKRPLLSLDSEGYSDNVAVEPTATQTSRSLRPSFAKLLLGSFLLNIVLVIVVTFQRVELSHSIPWRGTRPLYSV